MEPITFALILLGGRLLVPVTKYLYGRWRYLSSEYTMLIFGDKTAGKTSLSYFLQYGKPYIIQNGLKVTPEKTTTPIAVGKNVKVGNTQGKPRANLYKDFSGDKFYREGWRDAINEVDPQGIIYLLRGDVGDDAFRKAAEELFDDVLSQYKESCRNLRTLHVFINFADKWAGGDPQKERKKIQAVDTWFWNRIEKDPEYRHLEGITFQVHAIQLSASKSEWKDAERAIDKFGADLKGR